MAPDLSRFGAVGYLRLQLRCPSGGQAIRRYERIRAGAAVFQMVGTRYGQRRILENRGLAHGEAEPAAFVEIVRGSRTSVRIASIDLWVGSVKSADGAGVWCNHRRRVRLADVMKASSNRLGFTAINNGSLAQ